MNIDKKIIKNLTFILGYAFNPISWDYEKLSSLEKEKITEEEFNNLKYRFKRDPNYTQLCVWRGCIVGKEKIKEFEESMGKEIGDSRIRYEREYLTLSGQGGEGGRNDLLFWVHNDDIGKFTIPRIQFGISWWEDHVTNNRSVIPKDVIESYEKS